MSAVLRIAPSLLKSLQQNSRLGTTVEPSTGETNVPPLGSTSSPDSSKVVVMVPPFVDVGEWVRVDVETGRYVERAKARR